MSSPELLCCTRCKEALPADSFYVCSNRSSGRQAECKECQNARKAAWRLRYPERERAAIAAAKPRNADRRREACRRWAQTHPARNAAKAARYRRLSRDQRCACCPPAEFEPIYDFARAAGLSVDHIRPIAAGGLHCTRNLQLMTAELNSSKGARYAVA